MKLTQQITRTYKGLLHFRKWNLCSKVKLKVLKAKSKSLLNDNGWNPILSNGERRHLIHCARIQDDWRCCRRREWNVYTYRRRSDQSSRDAEWSQLVPETIVISSSGLSPGGVGIHQPLGTRLPAD
ncbi:hypothetical protein CBL_09172 [Carabus blaptoides fortunei]